MRLQPSFFIGLADRGFLDGFVAVPRPTGQCPGTPLMAPRRAVLQEHRRSATRLRRPQQKSGRAVATPEVGAVSRKHPSVTVALHGTHNREIHATYGTGPTGNPPPARRKLLDFY